MQRPAHQDHGVSLHREEGASRVILSMSLLTAGREQDSGTAVGELMNPFPGQATNRRPSTGHRGHAGPKRGSRPGRARGGGWQQLTRLRWGGRPRKNGWESGSATRRVGTQTSSSEDPHHGSEMVPSEPEGFVRWDTSMFYTVHLFALQHG